MTAVKLVTGKKMATGSQWFYIQVANVWIKQLAGPDNKLDMTVIEWIGVSDREAEELGLCNL